LLFSASNNETIFLIVKPPRKKLVQEKTKRNHPTPKKKSAGKRHLATLAPPLLQLQLTLHINHRCFFFRSAVL
jgi:hypothetical protein